MAIQYNQIGITYDNPNYTYEGDSLATTTSTSTSSTSTSSSSSTSTSTSTSTSSSSSSSTSSSSTTTEQIADYSRGDNAALGADDTDLENLFTWTEYQNVATNDGTRVAQTATNEYAEFLFKNKNDNTTDSIQVTWDGQSDLAPSSSTVYLQIYNRTTEEWETKDSDNSSAVNTDFELTSTITANLNNYYDVSGWVACRVYQSATGGHI